MRLIITIDTDICDPESAAALLNGLTPKLLAIGMLSGNPAPLCVNDKTGLRQVGDFRFTETEQETPPATTPAHATAN